MLINTFDDKLSLVDALTKILSNAQSIIDFDTRCYVDWFGENAVGTVQSHCENMPNFEDPDFTIQSMVNIAYDQGFQDCINMVSRILDRYGVDVVESLS